MRSPLVDELERSVKELAALDAHGLSDAELRDAQVDLARLAAAFTAAQARIAVVWDQRRVWDADGAKSGAAWLARETREPKGVCASRLRLGRALRDMPLVDAAWSAGDITLDHVRRLAGIRNRRTRAAFARDEAILVEAARTTTFNQFHQVVEYWQQHADPDGTDQSDLDRRDRRRVSLAETFGGSYSGSILLDPISGASFSNELGRLEQELFDADWANAKNRLGHDPVVGDLERTPDQRRADALVEMATRSAAMPEGGRAPKPLFTLLLGSDAFSHLMQLASGQVVPPTALLPWIADADLERVLFDGAPSRVIDVSYKRTFTGALRRLIEVRDQLCYHRYCDIPSHRCQIDHIQPWTNGGITSQDNGRVACGYHNRLRYRRPPPPD